MEQAIIIVLTLTSLLSLTFIIERGLALRWNRVIPSVLEEAADNCRTPEDLPMLRRMCEQHPSALGRLLLVAASHLDCPKNETIDALQTKARHEIAHLERGLQELSDVVIRQQTDLDRLALLNQQLSGQLEALREEAEAGKDPHEIPPHY